MSQICTTGYSESVRDVPDTVKQEVYAAYGLPASHAPSSYEVDHLIPLELGGDNSIANLWPEVSPGYHQKDAIENELHHDVCAGGVGLRAAQQQIAHDWHHTAAGTPTPAPAPRSTTTSSSRSTTSSSGSGTPSSSGSTQVVHPGAFCAPEGAHGVTSRGTPMTCKTSSTDTRARWRSSG